MDHQINNNIHQLDLLVNISGPCLFFLNHTADDFFALALIVRFFSEKKKKICILQRDNVVSESVSFPKNIMFCNVYAKEYMDKLKYAVNEKFIIVIIPDAYTALSNGNRNTINFKKLFGASRLHHHNPLITDLLMRDLPIYKKQLCGISKHFHMDVVPISGCLHEDKFELKVHCSVNYFSSKGDESDDGFMRSIYDEKIDYLVKCFSRWYTLESHLSYHAWRDVNVIDRT